MSDFGETKTVVGRKQHRCEACYHPIQTGERHEHFKGMYDGEWQSWRMHAECYRAYAADGYEEFMPGEFEPPERLRSAA